jgi:hypothetical protein
MAMLKLAAVTEPQTADNAATSTPAAFGKVVETLDKIPGKSQMLQGTARLKHSHLRSGSFNPQSQNQQPSVPSDKAPNSVLIKDSIPV